LGQGVFDKIRFYANLFYFIFLLCWYLVKLASFLYKKIPKLFGDLCWYIYGPLTCCFIIVFMCIVFYAACSIYGSLLLNTNLLCNVFFSSCLKRVNKKGKQKEKA
jgi:hypothetical protein